MLSFLFYTFLFYVLFKLVFDFIVPIYRTTKKVKQSFQAMHQQMQEQQNGSAAYQPSQNGKSKNKQEPLGDYIDFEEVKE
jgi:uncharacterized membrane-anchored protein YitT (DUF2179 family)